MFRAGCVPVHLQEALEDPALQRASPILARPSVSTLSALTEADSWFSFYVAYC